MQMTNWNLEVLVSVKRREKPLNYNKQAWNAVPIFNSVAESLRWDKVNASFDLLNLTNKKKWMKVFSDLFICVF